MTEPRTIRSYREFAALVGLGQGTDLPVSGSIELTQTCDLRCVHCYQGPGLGRTGELTTAQWKHLFDQIADAGCIDLLITGGEPMMRKDFAELYEYAVGRGMLVTLFTNATLVTREITECLARHPPFRIEVSIYGLSPPVAKAVTGCGSYLPRMRRGVEMLASRGLRVSLKTMVNRATQPDLQAMREYASGLGLDFRFDPFMFGTFDSGGLEQLRIGADEVIGMETALLAETNQPHRKLRDLYGQPQPDRRKILPGENLFACHVGKDLFHVDSRGRLTPCVLMREPAIDAVAQPFEDAWAELKYQCAAFKRTKDFACVDCADQANCHWCPAKAKLEHGDMQAPIDFYCTIVNLRRQERSKHHDHHDT